MTNSDFFEFNYIALAEYVQKNHYNFCNHWNFGFILHWKVFKNSVDKMKKSPVEPASMTTAWTRGSSPNLSKICPICSWTVLGKNLEASEENKTVKVKTETSTKNTETIHLVKFRSIFAPLDSGLSDLEFGPPLSPENKKRFYKKQTPFNFYGKFWTISLNMST